MTPQNKRFATRVLFSVGALVAVCVVAGLFVIQTQWFSDFLRARVIATLEDDTGGKVDIQSFRFEPSRLTVLVKGLVLHGTEPRDVSPLAAVDSIELRIKLWPSFGKAVEIPYLVVEKPKVNLIVNSDGTTNIPTPKAKTQPSSESPLATVVDLAIRQFRIDEGTLSYLQKQTPFSLAGNDFHAVLNYDRPRDAYSGRIQIAPLDVQSGVNQALALNVDLPLAVERNAIRVTNGRITSEGSQVGFDASVESLNAPKIAARLRAKVALGDLKRMLDLPLVNSRAIMMANLDGRYDESSGVIGLKVLDVQLGRSSIHAAGTANPANGGTIGFDSNLSVSELSALFDVGTTRLAGELILNGTAGMDAKHNYTADGNVTSRDLSVAQGDVHLSNVSITTPFHVTPDLISLDRLDIAALGGMLSAKASLSGMRALTIDGNLHDFSLRALASAFAGRALGYAGEIGGWLKVTDDLKSAGTSGLMAHLRLSIVPSGNGVPVNGQLRADYTGKSGLLNLGDSFIALPQSRATFSGEMNRQLNVHLTSRNLNDFSPLGAVPITLKGGSADLTAQVNGSLSAPKIEAQASVTRFQAQNSLFDKLSLELSASESGATVRNGLLTQRDLSSSFDGSIGLVKWHPASHSPVSANVSLQKAGLGDLLALGGGGKIPATGEVSADLHINGTYGDPLGTAAIRIPNGAFDGQAFSNATAEVNLSHGLARIDRLQAATAGGTINANGAFRHPADTMAAGHVEIHVRSDGVQLAMVKALQEKSPGAAGGITFAADAAGDLAHAALKISDVETNFTATNLRVRNQDAGNLTAIAHTASGVVTYNVKSNLFGSTIDVQGRTALANGYATEATAAIRSLPLRNALDIAGQSDVPVTGTLSADASMNGTLESPDVSANVDLTNGNLYEEPVNRLSAKVSHNNASTQISVLNLDLPAGHLSVTGRYEHPRNLSNGSIEVRVNGGDLQIGKLQHVAREEPELAGILHLSADAKANISESHGGPTVLLTSANADVKASGLSMDKHDLGGLTLTAHSVKTSLNFQLDSDIARSKIHAAGQSQLVAGYPTKASLDFTNVHYVNIAPFLNIDETMAPSFDALVEGKASVDGPLEKMEQLKARMELTRVEVHSATRASVAAGDARTVAQLQNDGPVILTLDRSLLKVEQFHIRGPKTDIQVSGGVNFAAKNDPLQLKLLGNADLGTLQDIDAKFYSSGGVSLVAAVGGTFSQPSLNGKIELKNASLNYADIPNGLSNANGVILLNGTTASVQNLTGESGGGKLSVNGFVGLSPRAVVYNLRANASNVRTRYDSVSVTSNANVTLTGNSRRALLQGKVTVERIAYSASSDIGSILYGASTPPVVASAPSPFLTNMRLDVNIVTASDVRIVTSYVQKLDLTSNLTLRGTAAEPGMLGHINVTDGELAFFGNTYSVNRGAINFYDPSSIKPELDFSLETIAQGVDVVLGVTGPMSDMKLSYRSDPPLSFEQIAQLLATNTTPFDPTIAAHQPPAPQQSTSQMGESAVLSQAVASPLASRVQRVFGLTQFKIDPSVAGSNGQPTAKVTLQQKIANNITFTYITDVTQSNSEIVRVQWDLGAKTSAVALRDYNGNVSVELFYKFQKR